jgi:uncharacterized protein YcbK (DUF882 family)
MSFAVVQLAPCPAAWFNGRLPHYGTTDTGNDAADELSLRGGHGFMNQHRTGHVSRTDGLRRRAFLGIGAAAAASVLLPTRVLGESSALPAGLVPDTAPSGPAPVATKPLERRLSFFNTHTSERLTVAYCCDGTYQPDALKKINHILRDHRANEIKPIDPKLLDLLHELGGVLETDQPFHVISGYRSPNTNGMLRATGGANTGVATQSLHMVGKAIDIRVPGVKLDRVRASARALKLGGVGYYPTSNFVHVDTGRVRFW